jgi:hypothetical protein
MFEISVTKEKTVVENLAVTSLKHNYIVVNPAMKVWDAIKPRNVSLALLNNQVEHEVNLIKRNRVKTNK